MKFLRLAFHNVSSGAIWPWGTAGNVITVGQRGSNGGTVKKIESHPHGFYLVTASLNGKDIKVAVNGECQATACEDDLQCEICGQFFENAAGLANHVKSHITPVKQVTEKPSAEKPSAEKHA